jgi:hypothetical protein
MLEEFPVSHVHETNKKLIISTKSRGFHDGLFIFVPFLGDGQCVVTWLAHVTENPAVSLLLQPGRWRE